MILPLHRERLREREKLDRRAEAKECREQTPGQRLAMALELSDVARAFARSVNAGWLRTPVALSAKARSYPRITRANSRSSQ